MLAIADFNSKLQTENNIVNYNYVNECSFFTCCSTINILYFLKFNMFKLEIFIGKLNGDANIGFKNKNEQSHSKSTTGISNCKFPRDVFQCGIKNKN